MPFSPEEIASKDFLITLRGYDKDEVRAFLRAIAADYSAALETADTEPASGDAYASLGSELAEVLQTAKESADRLRRRAEDEAASMRQRAEREAGSLREATTKAAKRLTDEAEQEALEVRAEADRYARDLRNRAEAETDEKLRDATRRLEKLRSAEAKLKQRLYSLETALGSIRKDFENSGTEQDDVLMLDDASADHSHEPHPSNDNSARALTPDA